MRAQQVVLCALFLPFLHVRLAWAQEIVLEEVRVEASFDLKLEPPRQSDVETLIERLTLRAESRRALDLKIANRTPLSTLLDLTKYSPIPLGGSENRVDTFFMQNEMRADLNPRKTSGLFDAP